MNLRNLAACVVGLALLVAGAPRPAHALGTAFTYQGQLQQGGSAATGPCDFQFALFDAGGSGSPPEGGNQIGNTAAENAVQVPNGLFTLPLDFGAGAFSTGGDRWLQIAVRCPAGSGAYQTLAPRQPVTPAPFALFASAVADGSVSSTKLASGAVTTSQLATNAVTSAQIADGTITMNDLANGAVSTTKIGDGQVTAAKLAAPLSLTSTVAQSIVGAFDGISTGLNGVGVSGTANNGSNAYGLFGLASAGYGVFGSSTSGTGVVGSSTTGTGVLGQRFGNPARGVIGTGAGVVGENDSGEGVRGTSHNGVGVLGQGAGDAGVKGTSDEDGVYGQSTGDSGAGVHGRADAGQGAAGVRGDSTDGAGVLGQSDTAIGVAGFSADGDGILGMSAKSNGNGVHGTADNGDSAHGVFGESADGAGVYGSSTNNFGVAGFGGTLGLIGVPTKANGVGVVGLSANFGETDSPNATGVRGFASSGDGVLGESTSGSGVYGESAANLTLAHSGVYGKSTGTGGIGVIGEANVGAAVGVFGVSTSATGYGMYARNLSGGYAMYADGSVRVIGTITAGAKPFQIDHPLDPANKYLMHAAVESPDMKNIYDGIAVLDDGGEAVVELPEWFEALNRDFRYQLTCIGGVAPVYIAEEVSNHRFRIAGGTSGLKVSWQVTGIRKDAFANAHPLVVELDKPAEERGWYLYPVEAGMPASLSVDRAKQAVAQAQVQ